MQSAALRQPARNCQSQPMTADRKRLTLALLISLLLHTLLFSLTFGDEDWVCWALACRGVNGESKQPICA
jgi:hypothetical protein